MIWESTGSAGPDSSRSPIDIKPVGVVLMTPGLDVGWILLLALDRLREDGLGVVVPHQRGKLGDAHLRIVGGLDEGSIQGLGWKISVSTWFRS